MAAKCTGIWNSTRWNIFIPAKGFSSTASKAGQGKRKEIVVAGHINNNQIQKKNLLLFLTCWMDQKKIRKWGEAAGCNGCAIRPVWRHPPPEEFYCRCWPSFSFLGSWSHSHITCFFFSPMWSSVVVVVVLQKQIFFFTPFFFCCLSAFDVNGYNMPDTKRNIWNIMAVVARQLNFLFLTLTIAGQRDKSLSCLVYTCKK